MDKAFRMAMDLGSMTVCFQINGEVFEDTREARYYLMNVIGFTEQEANEFLHELLAVL